MDDSNAWTTWEGQVIEKKYRLERFLGSTDHSAVFLTEVARPKPQKAAIKFISADFPGAEKQGDVWAAAAELNHPNLLRLYAEGHCRLGGMDLLYVVMEYAEENLGQVLPQRAMTSEETREVVSAATDLLVYLHNRKLTHGHLKPSNVMAKGNQLKFSSDAILPAGEVRGPVRELDAYDAPETASAAASTAGDVWSLGVTMVEALTQQAPALPADGQADPPIPTTLQEPFLEIARQTLRREAKLRWNSGQIAARLNPAAAVAKVAAASAGATARASVAATPAMPAPPVVGKASPVSVPLSKERAVPLAKLPAQQKAAARVDKRREEALRAANRTLALPSYVVPVFAAVLAVAAIIVLPKILRRHMETSLASIETSSQPSVAKPAAAPRPAAAKPAAKDAAAPTVAPEKSGGGASVEPVSAPAASAPPARSDSVEPRKATKSKNAPARGEVLEQVLPKTSEKALGTISGTVRVGVKAHVDAAGNVSDVDLENPGPSRYFAEQALGAARGWVFNTPEVDGRSVPSEWLIRFEFKPSGVKASANQSAP
jgi:TonB family protein